MPRQRPAVPPAPHVALHGTITEALAARRVLALEYTGVADAAPRTRLVEPLGVDRAGDGWVLVAWCREAGDLRRFEYARCAGARVTNDAAGT